MKPVRVVFATIVVGVVAAGLGLAARAQPADELSGTISATHTITRDTRLVGDVTCTVAGAPCIQIAASDVSLRLEGFSITGRADAATGCAGGQTNGEHGIAIVGQEGVDVRGPGVVQQFRGHGILVSGGSNRVGVRQVTMSTNCLSGIIITGGASDNDLEANISARNGNNGAPCGGI